MFRFHTRSRPVVKAGSSKSRMRTVAVVIGLFCVPSLANGELVDVKNDKTNVVLGFVGGIVFHELGHLAGAAVKGEDFEFDGLAITYPDVAPTGKDRLQLASMGFQFQWLATELAFHYLGRDGIGGAGANRAAGVILSHLAISAAYVTFLKHHDDGDVEGIAEATGASNDQVALGLAIPAVLDAWRLFGDEVPKWVPRVSLTAKGIGVGWVWTY